MTTLLSQDTRKAAHGRHICTYCRRPIAAAERYLDQRIAGDGTVWTSRAHLACQSAYWSWPVDEGYYYLADLTDGHLPPCWHAWDRDTYLGRDSPFIGPRPPCSCS